MRCRSQAHGLRSQFNRPIILVKRFVVQSYTDHAGSIVLWCGRNFDEQDLAIANLTVLGLTHGWLVFSELDTGRRKEVVMDGFTDEVQLSLEIIDVFV